MGKSDLTSQFDSADHHLATNVNTVQIISNHGLQGALTKKGI